MTIRSAKWVALAGMTTSAIVAGPLFAGIGAAAPSRSFSSNIALSINGASSGFVHKVEGGDVAGQVTRSPTYQGFIPKRIAGQPAYSNIKMSLDADAGRPIWLLVKSALDGREQSFDGTLKPLDLNSKEVSEKSFHDGAITGFTIPACNGSATPYFLVTVDEGSVTMSPGNGTAITNPSQKTFANGRVRVTLDGLPDIDTASMDAIDLQANAKAMTVMNHLVFRVAVSSAVMGYRTWAAGAGAKNGRLAVLSATGEDLLDFNVHGVTPVKLSINNMNSGASAIAIATIELAISQITIGGGTVVGP